MNRIHLRNTTSSVCRPWCHYLRRMASGHYVPQRETLSHRSRFGHRKIIALQLCLRLPQRLSGNHQLWWAQYPFTLRQWLDRYTQTLPQHSFSGVAYLSRTYRHREHTTEEPAYQLQKRKEVLTLFEAIGIADKVNEKAGKLSFGQQQRVAFIRSLCQPFDFIFLDEPISHLDDENGTIMGRLLTEEASRQGAGIIVTSIGKHLELDYDEIYQL